MEEHEYCSPEDMITFLLALCCRKDSSITPISRDKDLDKRFDDCHRSVIPIANDDELQRRLKI